MRSAIMIIVIALGFIVLDFITGLVKAVETKTFTSTKMRQGLYHKVGLMLCIILGVLVDFAQRYMDLGVSIPVTAAICVYICLMEISSILENVCKINPQLKLGKLTAIFGNDEEREDTEIDRK